jgi:hypothetical protein
MWTMSVEFGDEYVVPLTGERNFLQYTRPFASWEETAQTHPNYLEV